MDNLERRPTLTIAARWWRSNWPLVCSGLLIITGLFLIVVSSYVPTQHSNLMELCGTFLAVFGVVYCGIRWTKTYAQSKKLRRNKRKKYWVKGVLSAYLWDAEEAVRLRENEE